MGFGAAVFPSENIPETPNLWRFPADSAGVDNEGVVFGGAVHTTGENVCEGTSPGLGCFAAARQSGFFLILDGRDVFCFHVVGGNEEKLEVVIR